MSFLTNKTNYVRPHAKTSYIRPLCENETMFKTSFDESLKCVQSLTKEPGSLSKVSLKDIEEAKEKHLQDLNPTYSKLYNELDKIQTWRTSVELECKQKNKKVEELTQTVESQRKVVLDLQMQNEDLSLKVNEELQKRVSVLEKFYITKELCSTLRKKFNDLQGQIESYCKFKEAADIYMEGTAKTIEDLEKKFSNMCMESSEKIAHLNDALKNEKQNNLELKGICEQLNLTSDKQNKSFCKLIENYKEELKKYDNDLKNEKNISLSFVQEKKEMLQRVSYLEKCSEDNLQTLKNTEDQLKLTLENKLEIENKYASEIAKVDNLNRKCEELEVLKNNQKAEFEDNCLALKTTISSLENSLNESKQKLEEFESINEKLSVCLKEREEEKCSLEKDISAIKKEKEGLENKLNINTRIAEEITNKLVKEKNEINASLELVQEELKMALSDKENLTKLCSEKDEKLSLINANFEASVAKIQELSTVENKFNENLNKLTSMEADIKMQSELLASKGLQIEELKDIKKKYDNCIINIKELEESMKLKSEQLELKDLYIEELKDIKKKYDSCIINIKELEESVKLKSEQLELKDLYIEELQDIKEKYDSCLINIKELEESVKLKSEQLELKNLHIKELQDIKEKYATCLINIKELEESVNLKSEQLKLKEENVAELDILKQNCNVYFEKIMELEDNIQLKSELLDEKEEKISKLNAKLKEKESKLEKIEYENLELKDNAFRERESVKVCLECEVMKDKVKELDNLKNILMDKDKELENQRQRASHNLKLLGEAEDNFDEMRIRKEKEIIKFKDTINSLQHQLRVLKFEVGQVEKLKTENKRLQMNIEELKLQNAGDIQRLKTENEKQKTELDAMHMKYNIHRTPSDSQDKASNKQSQDSVSKKKLQKSPFQWDSENGEKMEADSSGEVDAVKEDIKTKCPNYKRFSKGVNKKVTNITTQSTPLVALQRKRRCESESSGSECLEIVFDNVSKKVGFTPKGGKSTELKKPPGTPIADKKLTTTQADKRRDMLTMVDDEISSSNKGIQPKTIISFTTNPSEKKTPVIDDNPDDEHFLKSTERTEEVNLQASPWMKRNIETKRTPSTPVQRKFFKTPLKEREFQFKKPELQNMWF